MAGEPVRVLSGVSLNGLEAWVGTVDPSTLRGSGSSLAQSALGHNEVVNAALSTGRTPIPARFGSYFPDDNSCIGEIATRRHALLATLDRIEAAVESPVLLLALSGGASSRTRPGRADAGAGRKYLEAVRERVREAERRRALVGADADRVSAAAARFVRAEVRSVDQRNILSIVHLVPRDVLDGYRAAIREIQPARGVRIVLGDVRAPYSFADLNMRLTGHDSSSPSRDE